MDNPGRLNKKLIQSFRDLVRTGIIIEFGKNIHEEGCDDSNIHSQALSLSLDALRILWLATKYLKAKFKASLNIRPDYEYRYK